MTRRPASRLALVFCGLMAGTPVISMGEMPRNSPAMAMVLAVNWPPQAPGPGQAAASRASSSASLILPAAWEPMPSKTLRMVISLLVPSGWGRLPGAMEPP